MRLGEWDVNNDSEFFPNVEFDVLSMKIHPDYYPGNLYNDLAVIRIDGFVDFARNAHISPVCLPDAFQVNRRTYNATMTALCYNKMFFRILLEKDAGSVDGARMLLERAALTSTCSRRLTCPS